MSIKDIHSPFYSYPNQLFGKIHKPNYKEK